MVDPGSPGDSTWAEGALSAPESSHPGSPPLILRGGDGAGLPRFCFGGRAASQHAPWLSDACPLRPPLLHRLFLLARCLVRQALLFAPREANLHLLGAGEPLGWSQTCPRLPGGVGPICQSLRANGRNLFWYCHVRSFHLLSHVCLSSVFKCQRVTRPHQAWRSPSLVACVSISAGLCLFPRDTLRQCCRVLLLVSFFRLFLCVFSGFR